MIGLDRAVEQLVALVDDVGLVVRPLDHRDQRAAALHDAAHRDLGDRHARRPVAASRRRPRLAAGAEQVEERIAPAVRLIGVGFRRRRRRWRRRGGRSPAAACGCGGGCRRRGWRLRVRRRSAHVSGTSASASNERVHHERLRRPARRAPAWRRGLAGAGLSSSTKVVATQVAVMVAFGSGLSLPLHVEAADVDDARELADAVEEDRQVVIRALELERDRPLGVQLLGDDRRRLEALDRQVRLRRHRLHAAQQIGGVLLLRQHRLQVVEPAFELVDLRAELRQLLRGAQALGDVGAQRPQLRLRAAPSRRASASRSSSRTRRRRRARARRTRRPARTTAAL